MMRFVVLFAVMLTAVSLGFPGDALAQRCNVQQNSVSASSSVSSAADLANQDAVLAILRAQQSANRATASTSANVFAPLPPVRLSISAPAPSATATASTGSVSNGNVQIDANQLRALLAAASNQQANNGAVATASSGGGGGCNLGLGGGGGGRSSSRSVSRTSTRPVLRLVPQTNTRTRAVARSG